MRFVVYGAGAVGGVIGARLFQHGHAVILIARGAHHDAVRDDGLTVTSPDERETLSVPVADRPESVVWNEEDVVFLAVKSQDTPAALRSLADVAPPSVPVVCVQNGVENERAALRRFSRVYGVPVMCPALHLEPGVVAAYSSPITGILDVGRWPVGRDDVAEGVARALAASTFDSRVVDDVARWKWGKLLTNLGNAIEAVCGPSARGGVLGDLVRQEGVACLRSAGIDFVPADEDRARRGELLRRGQIDGEDRPGGSSWQSLARGTGAVETDYLNGEVVLLGRLHGVATPANELLQRLANEMARRGDEPGTLPEDDVFAQLTG